MLNIFGLSMGLACCLFVVTLVRFEYSFDNWHDEKDNIYRVVTHFQGDNRSYQTGIIPYPTGDAILRDVPDFKNVIQFHGPETDKLSLTDKNGNFQVFRQDQILYTDGNFFDVMDFEILRGASGDILNEPNKIFLTTEVAKKYFGKLDPIGKTIRIDNKQDLEVVGIVSTPTKNTNLPFQALVSLQTMRLQMPDVFRDNWGMTWAYSCYVVAPEGRSVPELEAKLDLAMEKYADSKEDADNTTVKLQPLSEIHNDERYGDGSHYVTPSMIIWAFVFLAVLLTGTACLNFINLSTAQAIQRAKEVGVRKTLGGLKYQLITQFMIETSIIVLIALTISFTIGQVLISQFNSFLTIISYDLGYSSEIIFYAILLALVITILAGLYPSLILSGYKPVDALNHKINIKKGSGNFNLRRALVITQFAFTNLMLICTIIISAQMSHMKNIDLGFNYEQVVTIDFPEGANQKIPSIAAQIKTKAFVEGITQSYSTPIANNNWNNSYFVRGGEYIDGNNANMKFGDKNYLDFYQIPLIAGRNITEQVINDSTFNFIVNEKLISTLGWNTHDEALGQWIDLGYSEGKIIGIIEDFMVNTPQYPIKPSIISYKPDQMNQLALRLSVEPTKDVIADLENTFHEFYPNDLFEFSILENQINDDYLLENMMHQIIKFVCILSILLSIMGLYGLVSFMATKNAKDIGIRKVFGASTGRILGIFAKEYSILMILAFILSAPAAAWLMNLWIAEFHYQIDITYRYFLIGFIISFIIALGTVGYRSYRAAIANPINSLRYE